MKFLKIKIIFFLILNKLKLFFILFKFIFLKHLKSIFFFLIYFIFLILIKKIIMYEKRDRRSSHSKK